MIMSGDAPLARLYPWRRLRTYTTSVPIAASAAPTTLRHVNYLPRNTHANTAIRNSTVLFMMLDLARWRK